VFEGDGIEAHPSGEGDGGGLEDHGGDGVVDGGGDGVVSGGGGMRDRTTTGRWRGRRRRRR
jgi:hypothetical protein